MKRIGKLTNIPSLVRDGGRTVDFYRKKRFRYISRLEPKNLLNPGLLSKLRGILSYPPSTTVFDSDEKGHSDFRSQLVCVEGEPNRPDLRFLDQTHKAILE